MVYKGEVRKQSLILAIFLELIFYKINPAPFPFPSDSIGGRYNGHNKELACYLTVFNLKLAVCFLLLKAVVHFALEWAKVLVNQGRTVTLIFGPHWSFHFVTINTYFKELDYMIRAKNSLAARDQEESHIFLC